MKLYGFSTALGFPCVCFGNRGYFFKIRFVKRLHRFKCYRGRITAASIYHNLIYNQDRYFIGFMEFEKEQD